MRATEELEWKTRKARIDPKLDAIGWGLRKGATPLREPYRTEEHETANGPADYALWLDGRIVALVEAKKLTVGPQNVLTQAERYARGLGASPFDFAGLKVPFLYSTNGEVLWFHDVRNPMSRSRQVAAFHTPDALREMLDRDLDAALDRLIEAPNDSGQLYPLLPPSNLTCRTCRRSPRSGTGFPLTRRAYKSLMGNTSSRAISR